MNLQTPPESPTTHIQVQSNKRPRIPSVVEENLSMPTSPKRPILQLSRSRESSSGDDLLPSPRGVETPPNLFQHLESALSMLETDIQVRDKIKSDLEALSMKNTQDNIETLQLVHSLRMDLGSLRTRIEQVEQLQKIETNTNLHAEIKQQYNEQAGCIEELKQQYAQLATRHLLVNQIMSTSQLNSARTSENQASNSSQADQMTLEDILTKLQQELIDMGKMIQQLNSAPKKEPDYHNIIDTLRAQIAAAEKKALAAETKANAVESRNETIIRRAVFLTIGSVVALLTSFWFWLETHKA